MRIAMMIVRTLLGLLFLFASVTFLFNLITPPEIPAGPLRSFNEGLAASGYFMYVLKVTELICGLMLVTGYFVPLALVVLAPIVVNIFLVHAFLAPEGLPIAIFVVAAEIFLAYYYRDAFKPLLRPKYA